MSAARRLPLRAPFLLLLCGGTLVPYLWPVAGQHVDYPLMQFKNMTFDYTVRGQFNITHCIKDLMNCYEIMRPDMVCINQTWHRTACAMLQYTCDDFQTYVPPASFQFSVLDTYCQDNEYS